MQVDGPAVKGEFHKTSYCAGPRRPGEGTEDEAQGIVDAHQTKTG